MTLAELTRAVRLRDERVEAEQQPHREHTDRDEQHAAEADGTNRVRTKASDHQRIHDPHRHPSELRHHHGRGERQHRTEFAADHPGILCGRGASA